MVATLFSFLMLAGSGPFDYDRSLAFDIRVEKTERRGDIEIRDITFANLSGGRTAAYLVAPPKRASHAGILYVHWYEPPDPTSNRTEYLEEAVVMAEKGVISLLPATMWSEFEWFRNRKREEDLRNSLAQLRELRRALDLLLSQPGVDRRRVAYVGHDFGAMFGAVMAAVDRRACAYALQAGTASFTDWYLFGPPMKEPARSQYIRDLSMLDPVKHIGDAPPAPVLLQFATRDMFVSHDVATRLYEAARTPKELIFYDAEHKMSDLATSDRMAWLTKLLR